MNPMIPQLRLRVYLLHSWSITDNLDLTLHPGLIRSYSIGEHRSGNKGTDASGCLADTVFRQYNVDG